MEGNIIYSTVWKAAVILWSNMIRSLEFHFLCQKGKSSLTKVQELKYFGDFPHTEILSDIIRVHLNVQP